MFPHLSKDDPGTANKGEQEINSETKQYYAIASQGEDPLRFVLITGEGARYSIPYALLPICIMPDSSKLFLKSYELLISLYGRNLQPIEQHISAGTLKWVRACTSTKDDGQSDVFVKSITVEGQAVATEGDL